MYSSDENNKILINAGVIILTILINMVLFFSWAGVLYGMVKFVPHLIGAAQFSLIL